MPAHDKGILDSTYTLLYYALIQGCTIDSEFLGNSEQAKLVGIQY